MNPKVTVIVPTFNREKLICETIDSIFAQDYDDIEIIVIDDGSTDRSLEMIGRYAGRLRVISRENRGEGRTVNQGFSEATGKYVCVVNSDDPILPACISTLVKALEANSLAVAAYGDWVRIGPEHEYIRVEKLMPYTIHSMLRDVNFGIGPGTLIRRDAITSYGARREEYRYAGDMEFFMRLAIRGDLIHVPKLLATHRDHLDSASIKTKKSAIFVEVVDAFKRTLADPALPSELKSERHQILAKLYGIGAMHYSEHWKQRVRNRCLQVSEKVKAIASWGGKDGAATRPASLQRLIRLLRLPLRGACRIAQWFIFKVFGLVLHGMARRANVPPALERPKAPLFAFSSRFLPPMWSGQAVVIRRLLSAIPPEHYRLIGHPVLASRSGADDFVGNVGGRYFPLPPIKPVLPLYFTHHYSRPFIGPLLRFFAPVIASISIWHGSIQRARQIVSCFRDPEHRPKILIGCTGDYHDPLATLIAARVLGVKAALYYFDDYREQWWADRHIMPAIALIERFIVPRASFMIAPNEFMRDKLVRDFKTKCYVLRNPMHSSSLPPLVTRFPADGKKVKLVFTGAVYHLNYSVFRSIIAALEAIKDFDAELHIYTAQSHDHLRSEGIDGPKVVLHQHAKPEEVVEAQSNADILLIPFSMDTRAAELVRTSATAKLADYLATGRPILAIAGKDSFLSWYLRKNNAGIAAHSESPLEIAKAVSLIAGSPELRTQLRENARRIAVEEFDPIRLSQQLFTICSRESAG
ncbi:glycosyltransferase [Pannonibacter phragmitetus]|uniref:glycosyltransferase n=1 Tax=Pannonibacter phragmitetus TaxID=121719 RepID=UPI000B098F93|nr:glycosyltransferase [Pannonibacter phragmitetus]